MRFPDAGLTNWQANCLLNRSFLGLAKIEFAEMARVSVIKSDMRLRSLNGIPGRKKKSPDYGAT